MRNLRYYMSEMENGLIEIKSLINKHACPMNTRYFDVPRVTVEEEKLIFDQGYQHIPVKPILGKDAVHLANQALFDWYVYDNALSRRFLHKHPGIIVIEDYQVFLKVQELIQQLNDNKNQFRKIVQTEGNDWSKWEAVHDKFNYIITMAVYRNIQCFDEEYDAVYFNWVTRRRHQKFTRKSVLDRLDNSRAKTPYNRTQEQWDRQIADEIELIKSTSYESFSDRRAINYRPEVNLRKDNKMQSISAGLPIVLSSPPAKITPLQDLDVEKRSRRTQPDEWNLLIPRMHLYARADI